MRLEMHNTVEMLIAQGQEMLCARKAATNGDAEQCRDADAHIAEAQDSCGRRGALYTDSTHFAI